MAGRCIAGREMRIGSTIPTTHCLTEGRVRLQVAHDPDMRERTRTGAGGCGGS